MLRGEKKKNIIIIIIIIIIIKSLMFVLSWRLDALDWPSYNMRIDEGLS